MPEGEEVVLLDNAGDGGEGGGNEEEIVEGADGGEEQDGGEGGDKGDGKGGDKEIVPGDKRYGTKEFKADYAKLKEIDPALAQRFQRSYWKVANVDKLGTTQELTALKEAVDLHGGVEALTEMAEEVEASRALEEGFKAGDPKIIDGWATDYPDGFKKLLLPAFDKLEQIDGAAWEQQAGTVSTKFLEKYGVFDAFGQLGAALRDQKPEDAIRLYNDLVSKVLKPMQGLAAKSKSDPLAADRAKIDADRQAVLDEKQKVFYSGVRQTVNAQVTGLINKSLRTQLGSRRLTVDQGNRVRKAINAELSEMANTAAGYQRQYTAIMKAADHEKAVRFIVTNATKYVDKAVKAVLVERNLVGGSGGGGGTNRNAGGSGGGGTRERSQVVTGKPKVADVDWTRSDKTQYILPHGTVWLKTGKQAKW